MTNDAHIRETGRHRFWCCSNCQRTLGEIVGVRLVIIVTRERLVNFPLYEGMELTCPKCGAVSAYRQQERGDGVI